MFPSNREVIAEDNINENRSPYSKDTGEKQEKKKKNLNQNKKFFSVQ